MPTTKLLLGAFVGFTILLGSSGRWVFPPHFEAKELNDSEDIREASFYDHLCLNDKKWPPYLSLASQQALRSIAISLHSLNDHTYNQMHFY